MNKFELDKTMECFGLDKKDCYEINGCKYYNDGRLQLLTEKYRMN